MRFGIPVFGSRVAPRCAIADGMVVVSVLGNRVTDKQHIVLEQCNWHEVLSLVGVYGVDTIVCGGIARDEKALLSGQNITIVENVACTTDEVVAAIVAGCLRPGLGFGDGGARSSAGDGEIVSDRGVDDAAWSQGMDCLVCRDQVCLRGRSCREDVATISGGCDARDELMLESARDVALENERILCRLSELIYFCLEMKYRRIGLAYCVELKEAARILANVLRRLFEVVPVCCKVGGVGLDDPLDSRAGGGEHVGVACNPLAQARVLEIAGCELNVVVGLCLGVDSVFARATEVPNTTIFVKDKSLANNPIGAIYSDYYLKEAIRSASSTQEDGLSTPGGRQKRRVSK